MSSSRLSGGRRRRSQAAPKLEGSRIPTSLFTRNMSAGRGFIALAALVFGQWRPVPTMLACLLFGAAEALSIQMQGVVAVPVQFIQIVPYVLTLVVLAGFIGRARPPKALGMPYRKGR